MKVCIDIQPALAQRAGVGRYTRSLVEHLPEHMESDQVTLFCFDFRRKGLSFDMAGIDSRVFRWCPGRIVQRLWRTTGAPPFEWFAGRHDVYHFPNFIIPPVSAGRKIVTIHDASFLRLPQYAEDRNLRYLSSSISRTVEKADAIITDSEFSASELSDLLKIDTTRLFPIHLGIDDLFSAERIEALQNNDTEWSAFMRRHSLDKPYLLNVGTLEPRKNQAFLVELFEKMPEFDGNLVFAGMRGWKCEDFLKCVAGSSRAADIVILDYVPDNILPSLYANAEILVFPSFYEGFGFPPLEAMACGTPVVSSNGGSLSEILGTAAKVLGGFNVDEWRTETMRLISDTAYRAKSVEQGAAHARTYSWSRTASATWSVYRQVYG